MTREKLRGAIVTFFAFGLLLQPSNLGFEPRSFVPHVRANQPVERIARRLFAKPMHNQN